MAVVRYFVLLVALALPGLPFGAPAHAAEIKVLTAGAFKAVLLEFVAPFEKATGHKIVVENDTAGGLVRRVSGGEAFDLVVVSPEGFKTIADKGPFIAGDPVKLAGVGVGVAVKEGTAKPDISSVDALKKTLLAARSVAFIDPAAGGTSGIYLMRLFEKWGIADQIKPKAVLVPGGLVAAKVVGGEAEIGLQQISELLAVKGATLVGPLPDEVQTYTIYAGGLSAKAAQPEAARAFLKMLSAPDAAMTIKAKGMVPPGT